MIQSYTIQVIFIYDSKFWFIFMHHCSRHFLKQPVYCSGYMTVVHTKPTPQDHIHGPHFSFQEQQAHILSTHHRSSLLLAAFLDEISISDQYWISLILQNKLKYEHVEQGCRREK